MQTRKSFYESVYKKITGAGELKWHRDHIPAFIQKHINTPDKKGFALDIGCGAGSNAVFLAQNGWQVTGVDFVEKAIALAKENAETGGVYIDFIYADIFKWKPDKQFDLIFDSGCLHNFRGKSRKKYKKIILELMNNHAYFLLAHFSSKFGISIWGPVHGNKDDIETFFAPELKLVDFDGAGDSKLLFYLFQNFSE